MDRRRLLAILTLLPVAAATDVASAPEGHGLLTPGALPDTVVTEDAQGFYQELTWAPDGGALVLSVFEPSAEHRFTFHLVRFDVEAKRLTRLTDGFRDYWTSWSPDGSRIAFSSDVDGNADVWTMDPDGGERRRVTTHPSRDRQPSFSPDGRRIVFLSDRGKEPRLYVATLRDGETRPLPASEGRPWNPSWSPDGDRVVFYETDPDGDDYVWILETVSGKRRRLTAGVWPTWSPDGTRIVFVGPDGLSVIPADGSTAPVLLVPGASYGTLAPDGSALAYIVRDGTHSTVHLAQPDGSDPRTILARPLP